MDANEKATFEASLRTLYESNARRYRLSPAATKEYVAEQIERRIAEWQEKERGTE